jgi:hypothetical protein
MACKTFRDIAAEEAARKLVLAGQPNAPEAVRIAAFKARCAARLAKSLEANLPAGASDLLNAVGGDAYRKR